LLRVRDQVSHPYRNTGKTIVSYNLIFKFFDSSTYIGTDFEEAAVKAQKALLDITNWTKKWRI
jgi:hypothetical protein